MAEPARLCKEALFCCDLVCVLFGDLAIPTAFIVFSLSFMKTNFLFHKIWKDLFSMECSDQKLKGEWLKLLRTLLSDRVKNVGCLCWPVVDYPYACIWHQSRKLGGKLPVPKG